MSSAVVSLLAAAALAQIQALAQVHSTPMAGRWFPSETPALTQLLDTAYARSEKRVAGPPRKQLLALVVPHAGLQYSGVVAAASYRLLGRPANIILLAFPHRYPLEGIAAPKVEAYRTPLGEVKVNREAVASLGFRELDEKSLCDHSLENQLPFLQRSAPQASVIPLYVGSLDRKALDAAGRKLAQRLKQGDVVVASSDFTHHGESYGYTPFPIDAKLPERLRERATEAFERIGSLDVGFFDRFLAATGDTICGRDPIRLLMAALGAAGQDIYMTTADYMTSGDVAGDHTTSVGYGALAFYPGSAFTVDAGAQGQLLAHARATLDTQLKGELPGSANGTAAAAGDDLQHRTGVFVTIRKKGDLRGCIGTLSPSGSVPATVADRTLAAARSDPRFPPLTLAEGPVHLEISLLTPLKLLPGWHAFRDGLGAVMMLDGRGGLLLPQVAKEMKWNREQFLAALSQKAGLDGAAYRRSKARIYVFDAQVFAEAASSDIARRSAANAPAQTK